MVGDVPAERAELSSLQNDRIEEAQTPEETSESHRFRARVKIFVRDGPIRLHNVLLETFGRLRSHLDSILHNCYGELV